MSQRDYLKDLGQAFAGTEVKQSSDRRFWVTVSTDDLHTAVQILKDRFSIFHLSTIVGEDMRDSFLLSYVFSGEVVVTLTVKINREKPEVPSLAGLAQGSLVYERELHDLFGIIPVGHPDLRRQILPEDWPEGLFPLRKDVQVPRAGQEAPKGEN